MLSLCIACKMYYLSSVFLITFTYEVTASSKQHLCCTLFCSASSVIPHTFMFLLLKSLSSMQGSKSSKNHSSVKQLLGLCVRFESTCYNYSIGVRCCNYKLKRKFFFLWLLKILVHLAATNKNIWRLLIKKIFF